MYRSIGVLLMFLMHIHEISSLEIILVETESNAGRRY